MRLPNQTFIESWKPFSLGGHEFAAEVHERSPGSTNPCNILYLTRRGETRRVVRNPNGPEVTRVSYLVDPGQYERVVFLGMSISRSMRGRGLARELFRAFTERVENRGQFVASTGRIHKPLLALMLYREGFRPIHNDFVAEILPPVQSGGDRNVPAVRFLLENEGRPADRITGSRHGPFYELAEPLPTEVPIDYDKVVALHTPYVDPASAGKLEGLR